MDVIEKDTPKEGEKCLHNSNVTQRTQSKHVLYIFILIKNAGDIQHVKQFNF